MKITHNANPKWHDERPSAEVGERYEAEVQNATMRAENAYEKALRRLERAEEKVERARQSKSSKNRKRQIAELEAIVELRRIELEKYRRLMVATAASAEHRGRKSFRPVSFGGS